MMPGFHFVYIVKTDKQAEVNLKIGRLGSINI